ncbi:MAG: helix-turn-helix transcriptional regulator [Clostridia bacterium]|nr:helix-turn-helix transcriptional regulator [Clostridia bacterium]
MAKREIDITKLKETVVLKNMTLEGLAYNLGMSRSTLYRKLRRGHSGLTLKDVADIAKALDLSSYQMSVIFGGSYVPRV